MGPAAPDGERSTRPIADIDLAGVVEALGDNSGETGWWYDPTNGQVEMAVSDSYLMDASDEDEPYERGLVPIEPIGSRDAYRDMVEFSKSVADARASDLLLRALEGRGAFRRFRDTLHEFPDLRERWFDYSNAAREYRAIDWLLDERRVDPDDAEAARETRAAVMAAVLAEIGSPSVNAFDESQLSDRWSDIRGPHRRRWHGHHRSRWSTMGGHLSAPDCTPVTRSTDGFDQHDRSSGRRRCRRVKDAQFVEDRGM